jgi:hypothetical protein
MTEALQFCPLRHLSQVISVDGDALNSLQEGVVLVCVELSLAQQFSLPDLLGLLETSASASAHSLPVLTLKETVHSTAH